MAWTDEMVEQLKKMWQEGLTTGEIGKRLNVSKNSIVGKVHRLGLSGRPSPIKKKEDNEPQKATVEKKQEKVAEKKPTSAPASTKTATTPEPAPTPAPKPAQEKAIKEKKEEVELPEEELRAPLAKQERVFKPGHLFSLTDLDNHTCRWPIGDPKDENFHFCGKKVRIGQTYCDEHSAIAYVKPGKK